MRWHWPIKESNLPINMRKRIFGKKLSRGRGARRALFRALARAMIISGKIKTPKAKAKFIQGQLDKLINSAKKDSVFTRRKVLAELGNDRETADLLFKKIVPVLRERTGGFTRIITLPKRRGDAADVVRMEWVEEVLMGVPEGKKPDKKESKKTKKMKKTDLKSKK